MPDFGNKLRTTRPTKMTLSEFLIQARDHKAVRTQSGLMDGEKACIIAAVGEYAERLMRLIEREFELSEDDGNDWNVR